MRTVSGFLLTSYSAVGTALDISTDSSIAASAFSAGTLQSKHEAFKQTGETITAQTPTVGLEGVVTFAL